MKCQRRRIFSLLLATILTTILLLTMASATAYPVVTITGYIKATNNKTAVAYSTKNGSSCGFIYAQDDCKILNCYADDWCRVNVPWSGYTNGRIVYTRTSYFFGSVSAILEAKVKTAAYARSDLKTRLGYVYVNDVCYVVGTSGNYYQILCPWSNGTYRIVWTSKSAFTDTGTGSAPPVASSTAKGLSLSWSSNSTASTRSSGNSFSINGTKVVPGSTFYTYYSNGKQSVAGDAYYVKLNGSLKYVGAAQCMAYAYYCQNLMYGCDSRTTKAYQTPTNDGSGFYGVEINKSLSASELKQRLTASGAGTHIRARYSSSVNHSIIVLAVNSNGFYYTDCNTGASTYGGNNIRLGYTTFHDFAAGSYSYIRYLEYKN